MEAIDFTGPEHQARHMARYISCPSTIRAHCLNDWGRAPKMDSIKAWQDRFRQKPRPVAEPKEGDGMVARLGKLPPVDPKPHRVITETVTVNWSAPIEWQVPQCTAFLAGDLIASVAKAFRMTRDELAGASRAQRVVGARSVAVRILRERGWSHERIGRLLGRSDHTTIINALAKFDVYARKNPDVLAVYNAHKKAGWCGLC